MCFGIVFAALIEFACINFIDTLIRRIKKKEKERMSLRVIVNLSIFSVYVFYTYPYLPYMMTIKMKKNANF